LTVNIADLLRPLARFQGDDPALIDGEREITFRELDLLVRKMATCLLDRGVRPGSRVGIVLRDNVDHVVTLFAVWSIEAVAIPLDFRSRPAERKELATHFQIDSIIAARTTSDRPCIVLDEKWWQTVDAAEPLTPGARDATAIALVILSSGTTGRPKGFLMSHIGLLHRLLTHQRSFNVQRGDRYLNVTPLYFSAGRNHIIGYLLFGATVILGPVLLSPPDIVALIERYRANMLFAVTSVCRQLLEIAPASKPLLPHMKLLHVGGETTSPHEAMAFFERLTPNTRLVYASTISGLVSMLSKDDMPDLAGTVGRPILFTDIEIVDDEGQPLGPGEVGRIRVREPGMAEGVCGLSDDSEVRDHLDDGWAYPGDLGVLDENGILSLRGRYTDTIIRGGANIDPVEIETAIRRHPAVEEVAVVGVPSKHLGQEIVAFIVAHDGLDSATVRNLCRRDLVASKWPSDIVIVDSLPRNTAGKVVKRDLIAAYDRDAKSA
jgi:long-chain acyl-CoA synthetase